jgi:hypothetical protein
MANLTTQALVNAGYMRTGRNKRSNTKSDPMKNGRVVQGIREAACVVLLLLTCGALSAQNAERGVRNIVLVHGSWG